VPAPSVPGLRSQRVDAPMSSIQVAGFDSRGIWYIDMALKIRNWFCKHWMLKDPSPEPNPNFTVPGTAVLTFGYQTATENNVSIKDVVEALKTDTHRPPVTRFTWTNGTLHATVIRTIGKNRWKVAWT
jgi:hypothetical protein